MVTNPSRERAMEETRVRILDVARDLLGRRPEASMGEIAAEAGVVRRTVYGHFPTRNDLVRALAAQAAAEMQTMLAEAERGEGAPDEVWARFVTQVWPLAHRYRVLLALRRGNYGEDIHSMLRSVDADIAALIGRGQDDGTFGTYLPPDVLARLSSATVFAIAVEQRRQPLVSGHAATASSLLLLGVPPDRASELTGQR